MKTFELPISDCGFFVGGEINAGSFDMGEPTPRHGIIIWYEDKETCKAALQAVMNAHWDTPTHSSTNAEARK